MFFIQSIDAIVIHIFSLFNGRRSKKSMIVCRDSSPSVSNVFCTFDCSSSEDMSVL
mgnify:CR=1 FL=1